MSPCTRYILRALGRSGLLDVVSLSAPELEESYEEMITEQKRLYSQVRGHKVFIRDVCYLDLFPLVDRPFPRVGREC